MIKNKQIDLKKYKRTESKIFTGRDKGQEARKSCKLDEFDKNDSIVEINIPKDTLSVNSSFFLGMFQKSIKELGEKRFREKYIFKCENEIIIKINIEKDIEICLMRIKYDEISD